MSATPVARQISISSMGLRGRCTKKRDEVAPAARVKKNAEGSLRMKLRKAAEIKAAVAKPARARNNGSTYISAPLLEASSLSCVGKSRT
jgi:hypothetical protein